MAKKRKMKKIMKVNIGLFIMTVLLVVCIGAVNMKTGIEIEKLKVNINKQSNKNQSITMKINELASPENVQLVAQNLGLEYNNNNIVSISK